MSFFYCHINITKNPQWKQEHRWNPRKPVRVHTEGTRWESQWGQGVGEVGRPGWNETNGTENVSANWTRLFLVAKNFNKVSFQPRDMEATPYRKRLPGCYNLGVHIHFSHRNGLWMQFCQPTLFKWLPKSRPGWDDGQCLFPIKVWTNYPLKHILQWRYCALFSACTTYYIRSTIDYCCRTWLMV